MKVLRRALTYTAAVLAVQSVGCMPGRAAADHTTSGAEVVRERMVTPSLLAANQMAWECGDVRLEADEGGVEVANTVTVTVNGMSTLHKSSVYRGATATGSDGRTYRIIASGSEKIVLEGRDPTGRIFRVSGQYTFVSTEGSVETWRYVAKLWPIVDVERGSCRLIQP